MKILDWYILKRYLGTFATMLLLFIPIGITVNLAEKIDKILEKDVPFGEIVIYYLNFTVHFANILFPLFLFLSVLIISILKRKKRIGKNRKYIDNLTKMIISM